MWYFEAQQTKQDAYNLKVKVAKAEKHSTNDMGDLHQRLSLLPFFYKYNVIGEELDDLLLIPHTAAEMAI
ncbi:hypothetical protein BLNAU_13326 [Blattamonas nauphoetae]|uniref:Uncharacterized protein n=1 Tax=Blattamonas nauphoetae TaxID=2049346 RepID=A0ABQ9XLL8_9EUKA|nr:hypothetical protein BLNAU_13326 [Blattamonas nauphoetae]